MSRLDLAYTQLGSRPALDRGSGQLPPLGGRPYAEYRAERLGAIRDMFGDATEVFTGLGLDYHKMIRAAIGQTTGVGSIIRAYRSRTDGIDVDARTVTCRIGSAALDRYRTVIDPQGIELRDYARNSVVLWEHGRDPARGAMPIGKCVSIGCVIGPDGPELIAKARFFEDDEFSKRLWARYCNRDMSAWSVNVVPTEEHCSPPTRDEIRRRPELASCLMMYRRSVLAEFSAVAVGGNQEALTLAFAS